MNLEPRELRWSRLQSKMKLPIILLGTEKTGPTVSSVEFFMLNEVQVPHT